MSITRAQHLTQWLKQAVPVEPIDPLQGFPYSPGFDDVTAP